MKRGQATIFIIIGILIMFVVITFLSFDYHSNNKNQIVINTINNYIISCLDESLIKSLRFFGTQGIIYDNSDDFRNLTYFNVPYYYYQGESRISSLDESEKIIANYSGAYFEECINDFKIFIDHNIRETGEKEISIKSSEGSVNIFLEYPLIIKKGNYTVNIEGFETGVDFDFKKVYNIAYEFIKEQDENPNYIPMGYLGILSYEEKINIQYSYLTYDDIIYTLTFDRLKLLDKPYVLSFAIKYDFSSLYENENKTEG
ncbi:hypothetical protein CMI42_06625 [Candidatus Pacearchaeota archaeon]|nr:hypothetical protein [Candidatus Pacearchaeota archaeon]|tara:strand:- start:877 stop:1650 length:774 start_codon:yes stop_codon:yes gene_type:complete